MKIISKINKMKNICIVLLLSSLTMTACNDDFLEKLPLDKISDSSFWQSGADVQMYANQFYPTLFDARLAWYDIDNYSDNQTPTTRNSYTWGEYPIPSTGGGWAKSDWINIRSCNYALDRIAKMKSDPSVLNAEGEIRFFKSFYYFQKVRKFGDVPWQSTSLHQESAE